MNNEQTTWEWTLMLVRKQNGQSRDALTQIGSPRWLEAGAHVFNGPQHPGSGPPLMQVKPGEHLLT